MRICSAIIAAAFVLMGASAAQASTKNFTGDSVGMGSVPVSQTGAITGNKVGSDEFVAKGTLAAGTMITFSYTGLTSGNPVLYGQGTYNYKVGKTTFAGTAYDYSNNTPVKAALALAFASITGTSGTIVIINNSAKALTFMAELSGFFGKSYSYTYNVSAVPLPQSMLLFMTGMLLFTGLRRQGKKQA